MSTLTEWVVLDKTGPARAFGNLVKLELREDGTAISGTVTRAVLTLTDTDGAVTVLDSDTDFTLAWAVGVLSLDLSEAIDAAGAYAAELDVLIGDSWYRWTLTDRLVLVAE